MLDETYGVIVYQDQVLKIMQEFAGYSLGKADIVRKAMGKKIPQLMRTERRNFVQGAVAQGHDTKTADRIFDLIEPFAGYAFNKAHSVSYAMLTYWTAYCKANQPLEYLTATLNARRSNANVYTRTLTEISRMEIKLSKPDIASGNASCDIVADGVGNRSIRLGLGHVKGVGRSRVEKFILARDEAPETWESIEAAFAAPAMQQLGPSAVQHLAQAGAFDRLAPRRTVLDNTEALWQLAQRASAQRRPALQQPLLPEPEPAQQIVVDVNAAEYSVRDLRALEEETMGIAVTPPDRAEDVIDLAALAAQQNGFNSLAELKELPPGIQVKAFGRVSRIREGNTKQGKPYRRMHIILSDGELEAMAWSELIEQAPPEAWELGAIVCIVGELQERRDTWSMSCRRLTVVNAAQPAPDLSPRAAGHGPELRFAINTADGTEKALARLRRAIRAAIHYPGEDRLVCVLQHPNAPREIVEIGSVKTQSENPDCVSAVQKAATE